MSVLVQRLPVMFPAPSSASETSTYDFESEENAAKWRGLLVAALRKVQAQVHPSLQSNELALEYVESQILRLLGMLCASQPHTVHDVEDRVVRTFPHPIDKWAMGDAQIAIERGRKKSDLVIPLDKFHALLQKEVFGYKTDYQVSLYIVAVLEYISADILKLAGNYVKNIRHDEITCQDVKVAMCADKVLMDMFYQDEDVPLSIEEEPIARTSLTYVEVVKDLVHEEKQYLRDLNMIIKVFREPFISHLPKNKNLDVLDSCIMDVFDFTVTLLGSLEDTVEMTEENQSPSLGTCFQELAEMAEFDVYERYTEEIFRPKWKETLLALLQHPAAVPPLQTAGHNFLNAVKYVLPKLLLGPIYHCFQYFEYIKLLIKLTPAVEDRETLIEVDGILRPLQVNLERTCSGTLAKRKPGEASLRPHSRISRQVSLQRMNELQRSIDGWEGKDIGQCCSEFVYDGLLGKVSSARRVTERYVFLFDGLMILCKQNNNRRTSVVTGPVGDYRLKEKFFMRKIDILDHEDTEELKNAFDVVPRDQPRMVLFCKTPEEKNNWMAAIIMLNTRSMLERTLDSILLSEKKKHPLWLPPPEMYRFEVEDSEENIVFEDKETTSGVPVIKGATLLKLVERLTYHMYADPMFVRTFLTTYRSFCQPQELLDLLTERFDIPEPPPQPPANADDNINSIERENLKNSIREDLKRFRKEYSQPVQFRVLNVLRHWIDHHFYDFVRDPSLLQRLQNFLDTVKGKSMKKWVVSVRKIIQRRHESAEESREIMFGYERSPPAIEWHLTKKLEEFNLLTLHPIEMARQLTLLEFELFQTVKPSELVGAVWTKKDKEKTSPNLLSMIHHSTGVTLWFMKSVVETENIEERAAVVSRILEVMIVLQELNNFTGVLEVVSAMNSASVYRLEHTFARISDKLLKALDEAKELNSDHYKKYQEKLRSINPPCVPFLGMYLTNILHIEEGNPDFLPNCAEGIINFNKRRKVANITGEIQQYQNQPYCLSSHPDIRHFLEKLRPLEDQSEKEFSDYLYSKSLEIEPRNCRQPPKFSRKLPDHYLKSPGIKLRSSGRLHPGPLPSLESTLLRGGGSGGLNSILGSSTSISSRGGGSLATASASADDKDVTHSPRLSTPPTPSSPSWTTPPPVATSDSSVFAPVFLPPGGNVSPGLVMPPSARPPPPLPPRRQRESSVGGETSPRVQQAPDAPMLPPRDTSSPPPLPPRRDHAAAAPTVYNSASMSRVHSNSHHYHPPDPRNPRIPAHTDGFVPLLPRRNSILESSTGQLPMTSVTNFSPTSPMAPIPHPTTLLPAPRRSSSHHP